MGKDRYYYRADGSYRGKSSNNGPVAQALGALIMLGIGGLVAAHFITEFWWELSAFVVGVIVLSTVLSLPILLLRRRRQVKRIVIVALIALASSLLLTAILLQRYTVAQVVAGSSDLLLTLQQP